MHPRTHLSWTQLNLWEKSPKQYREVYIEGKKIPISRAIALGKEIADALEKDEDIGEFEKDVVISRLLKYEMRDRSVEMKLKVGKEEVPILIKPDSMKADYSAFREYKTGSEIWTQAKVDKWDQLTFYATGIFIITKKIPAIHLDWAETKINEEGKPELTGEIYSFPTIRRMSHILSMMARMRKVWKEIGEMCENEI